VTPWRWLSEC